MATLPVTSLTQIRDVDAARGDARLRPLVGGGHELSAELLGPLAHELARDLDHDLVEAGLDGVAELVPVLRDDRERRDRVPELRGEVVDLGGRHVPSGEDPEVDPDL